MILSKKKKKNILLQKDCVFELRIKLIVLIQKIFKTSVHF